jgi:hypothetical protein
MDNTKGWILVIGILLVIGLSAFLMIWIMYTSVQRTVQPVQAMGSNLSTSIAEVLNPTPTVLPNPMTIIRDVRSLARLETIQYTIEKVITAETGQGPLGVLFGDKLIFVAHGQVIAGVDLSKLDTKDLEVKDGVLYVRLPEAEIFVTNLDNEKSYVYDRETGFLTKGEITLETNARRAAESAIEEAAIEDGVLDLARRNAESFMDRLFRDLGYVDVIYLHEAATPTP